MENKEEKKDRELVSTATVLCGMLRYAMALSTYLVDCRIAKPSSRLYRDRLWGEANGGLHS